MKTFDEAWEKIHQTREWGKYPNIDVVKFVARNYYKAADRKKVRILDLGCGAGANTWFLAREGFDTYGIDGSNAAIEKAGVYFEASGLTVELHVGDIAELPYEDGYFDAVIDAAVISANLRAGIIEILGECFRILKDGGKILSTGLFNPDSSVCGKGIELEELTYTDIPAYPFEGVGKVHYFMRDEIRELYQTAGFKDLCIDKTTYTEFDGAETLSYYIATGVK